MKLTTQLYKEIVNDLKKDFPNIKKIEQEEDSIIVISDDDTLWQILETLFNGVENIEFNAGLDEEHYLIIKP